MIAGLPITRTRPRRTPRARRGFTLMEVLIASAILAIVVGALTVPLSLAAKQQQIDSDQTTSAAIATQAIERMMTMSPADVLALNGTSESGLNITDFAGAAINDPSLEGFVLTISASEVPLATGSETPAEAPRYVLATATVTHPDTTAVIVSRLFPPQ